MAASPRVAGGNNAPEGRFPYMCSLRPTDRPRKHVCGGTLVDPLWVLTAAHCLRSGEDAVGRLPVVYCGIWKIDDEDPYKEFFAVDAVLHEHWNWQVGDGYDIAMLKLDREAQLAIPRRNIPNNLPTPATLLGAIGWGATMDAVVAETLQVTRRLVVSRHDTCNDAWTDVTILENMMLCAGIGAQDTCQGDSGGPLLMIMAPGDYVAEGNPEGDIVYGITSFGAGECGKSSRPGVYTDVGYFRDWIEDVIAGRPPSPPIMDPPSTPSPSPSLRTLELQEVVEAIANDDPVTVRSAVASGLDPNDRFNDTVIDDGTTDDTLLHWAAYYHAPDSAEALIELGADVEGRNSFGNTALHYCGIFGSTAVAKVLLENGAIVDADGLNGWRPLHYAARGGKVEVAELFLEGGADAGRRSDSDQTPLHVAARFGRPEVVRVLINFGADPDILDGNFDTAADVVCKDASPRCSRGVRETIHGYLDSSSTDAQGSQSAYSADAQGSQ